MRAVLLDTNAWSWAMLGRDRLTKAAQQALVAARLRYLSPVSFYEVAQKAGLGKWPEMASHVPRLRDLAEMQGLTLVNPDTDTCLRAGVMDWSHRDPFDRLLAATALQHRVPIVSADAIFDGVVERIW